MINASWEEKWRGPVNDWATKQRPPAVITCVRLKIPFFEDACVWDTTDLENRHWLKPTLEKKKAGNETIYDALVQFPNMSQGKTYWAGRQSRKRSSTIKTQVSPFHSKMRNTFSTLMLENFKDIVQHRIITQSTIFKDFRHADFTMIWQGLPLMNMWVKMMNHYHVFKL